MDQKIEPKTDREILISMNNKLTNLCNHLDEVKKKTESEEGFARCIHKDERIKDIEGWQKAVNKILVGISITVGAATILFVGKCLWDHTSIASAFIF